MQRYMPPTDHSTSKKTFLNIQEIGINYHEINN